MTEMKDDTDPDRPSEIRFTMVIQSRHRLETPFATGRQIKEMAGVPADYSLHRRGAGGGTEAILDDDSVEVRNGDHFFAQPRSQQTVGHNTDE